MHQPLMMFSAAHSALFEEARQQAREHARPQLLWKRGFHSEGGRAGWGYYLEAVPSDAGSTVGEGEEESVADDEDRDGGSDIPVGRDLPELVRHERLAEPTLGTWTARAGLMASHARHLLAERTARMAVKTHAIASLWFALTIPVIFWDAGYCFFRPRSMVGGDLHWIWKPYAIYQEVDYVYGVKALQEGNGFTNAQSLLNIVENLMNVVYLYLAHVSGSPAAPLLGFASVTMTLSKTVLYWAQEYYCGFCAVGHNDFATLFIYWILPNGLWLLVPSYIIYLFTKDITSALRVTNATAKKTKKQ